MVFALAKTMPANDPILPIDLERQLEAIERSANILPPHVLVEDVFDLPPVPRRARRNSPHRHALSSELRRSLREAERVRRLGIVMILVGVLVLALGALFIKLGHGAAGTVGILVGGALVGFSAVSLYKAAGRVQDAELALEELDGAA